MNKNEDFLDKINYFRGVHPDADFVFLVSSDEVAPDCNLSSQEIKSVDLDEVFNDDGQIIIGEDAILEHICEGYTFGYDVAKELGIDIASITVDQWIDKGTKRLNEYRANGTIKNTIIVKTEA